MLANARAADAALDALRGQLQDLEHNTLGLDVAPLLTSLGIAEGAVRDFKRETEDAKVQLAGLTYESGAAASTAANLGVASAAVSHLGDEATQTTAKISAMDAALASAGAAGAVGGVGAATGGGGGGAAEAGLLAAAGIGAGRGLWLPPPFGWGFRGTRVGGGMAAFGSLLGLAGFGAERAIFSTLGVLGSMGGGLIGGGLLGAGVLGTSAVGMGTDLAGIGQAAGDIKNVSQAMTQLKTAIATYGKNSTEAATAQAQLNQALAGFSPVARSAVQAAAQTSQAFKSMFDQATGQAEKTGAQIIQQAMLVGEKFLPTIGAFAAENMHIIQAQLQPLFSWLGNASFSRPGFGGGLGIFTNLEQIFQRNLPTAVQAGSQAFEFLTRTVDVAAQQTGHFMQTLDSFFTRMNQPGNFASWAAEVNKLIGLFRSWFGLLTAGVGTIAAIFRPAVGFGQALAVEMTKILDSVKAWLNLGSTQSMLNQLFSVHLVQTIQGIGGLIQALLPEVEAVVSAFVRMETIMAGAFTAALRVVNDIINAINKIPFAATILGWGAAFAFVAKVNQMLFTTMGGMLGLLPKETSETVALTEAMNGLAASMERTAVAQGVLTEAQQAGVFGSSLTVESVLGLGGISTLGATLKAGLMRALPLALGGLIAGQISQQFGGPSALTRSLQLGGVGAGLGFAVGGPVGAAVGGGLGAAVGVISSLIHSTPTLTQETNKLGVSFALLAAHSKATGLALQQYQQEAGGTLSSVTKQFATNLGEVAQQARTATTATVGFSRGGMAILRQTTVSSSQATADFIQKLQEMATSMQQSKPKVAAVYQEVAALIQALHQMPTRKNILIDLRVVMNGTAAVNALLDPSRSELLGILGDTGAFAAQIKTAVPKALEQALVQAEAGQGGSVAKANAAIYAFYEKQLKQAGLTAAQRTALYQAMIPYAPAPGTVPSANVGATGTALLSPAISRQLLLAQQAQAAAQPAGGLSGGALGTTTTQADLARWINANQKVMASARQALDYLRAQHYTQQQQNAALQQEKQLLDQIAAAHRNILHAQQAEHQLQVQGRINRILGIGGSGAGSNISIEQHMSDILLRGLERAITGGHVRRGQTELGATAAALGISPAQLAQESPTKLLRQLQQEGVDLSRQQIMELKKIQEVLRISHREGTKLNTSERQKIEAWLSQINTTLTGTGAVGMASNYIPVTTKSLISGLGLSPEQAKAERQKLAQDLGHLGKRPTGTAVGGIPLTAGNEPVYVHNGNVTVTVNSGANMNAAEMKRLAEEIRAALLRSQRRNGAQTRGQNAGRGVGLG